MTLRKYCRAILLGCATISVPFACAYPSLSHAQEQVHAFDIPAQELDSALRAFARTSLQQVAFEGDAVKGKRSTALKGEYTVLDALDRLLRGSGLSVRMGESGLLIVGDGSKTSAGASTRLQSTSEIRLARADGAVETGSVSNSEGRASSSESGQLAALEEIVVTAQKREERLREVPISISAVTGEQLQRSGATRFSDVAGYIPGLTYQPGISGAPGEGRFNLRGVNSATTPIATTAIYVDDVPTTTHGTWGGSTFKALDLFPYDVERVEVLRGPQGTLYGDSTIGGLVKYVTRQADVDDFSSTVGTEGISISGGEGIGGGARGMVNAPIAPGVFGVRLSGFYQETPGYLTNLATGEEGTNWVEQRGLRLAARLTPTEDFSVEAQWLHSEYESGDRALTRLVPGTTRPFTGDYENFSPVEQPTSQKFDLASLTGRYDFGPVNLTSVSAYSKVVRGFTADYTFFVRGVVNGMTGGEVSDALGVYSNPNETEKFTQEFRLASAQDQPLSWLVGAYYTEENTDLQSLTFPYFADGTPITDLPEIYTEHLKARYTDVSLFGNLTRKLTDKWEVSA